MRVNKKFSSFAIKIVLFFLFISILNTSYTFSKGRRPRLKPSPLNEYVILLHGMGRTSRAMAEIETRLSAAGYQVTNLDYPSTDITIEEAANDYLGKAVAAILQKGENKIHLVTHSLGGIVVREYLQKNSLPEGSRIVMLAPPNHGSELADFLKDNPLYEAFMGPAGQALTTDPASKPNTLGPLNYEIGIITGNEDHFPIFSFLFNGPYDGKVSVESARLPEMTDFLVVPCGHTFIMNDDTVIMQIQYFLKNGKFLRDEKHGE